MSAVKKELEEAFEAGQRRATFEEWGVRDTDDDFAPDFAEWFTCRYPVPTDVLAPTAEERQMIGRLLIRGSEVQKYMALRPVLMVPESFMPGLTGLSGYDVIRGPEFGVVLPV